MDVEITVFYANFTSEIGDDGNRVVDLRTLATYEFQEDVDHEVTYQANIELLKVSKGALSPSLAPASFKPELRLNYFQEYFSPSSTRTRCWEPAIISSTFHSPQMSSTSSSFPKNLRTFLKIGLGLKTSKILNCLPTAESSTCLSLTANILLCFPSLKTERTRHWSWTPCFPRPTRWNTSTTVSEVS